MLEFFFLIILTQAVIFGFFCAFVAGQKNRSVFGWFVLGFVFSFLAILALIAIPAKVRGKVFAKIPETNTLTYGSMPAGDRFEGERVLSSSKYQLFLVKQFEIEKNITLDKYTMADEVYSSLEEALFQADKLYSDVLRAMISREQKAADLSVPVDIVLRGWGFQTYLFILTALLIVFVVMLLLR